MITVGLLYDTVVHILNLILTILGIQQAIQGQTQHAAQETTAFLIQDKVNGIETTVDSITFGNNALHLQLNAIQATLATLTPVTLPTTPPAGYGAPDAATVALAVWDFSFAPTGVLAGDALNHAFTFAQNVGSQLLVQTSSDPKFYLQASGWDNPVNESPSANTDFCNYDNILPTDDRLTFVKRETGDDNWFIDPLTGFPTVQVLITPIYNLIWPISEAEFDLIKIGYPPRAAPVWPGIAGVTLGTPLALADGITVPGPLDGVIVAITSVPTPISFYPFGALKSFVRAGAIAFVDDNGDAEFPQPFGPENLVICPRAMKQVDHALVRLPSGVIGTITPWLAIN